jgi:hypothetical protein
LSQRVFNDFIVPYQTESLAVARIDISFTYEAHLQDQFSQTIDNGTKKCRYYVNEIEINPSFYFHFRLLLSNGQLSSNREYQAIVLEAVTKSIDRAKEKTCDNSSVLSIDCDVRSGILDADPPTITTVTQPVTPPILISKATMRKTSKKLKVMKGKPHTSKFATCFTF